MNRWYLTNDDVVASCEVHPSSALGVVPVHGVAPLGAPCMGCSAARAGEGLGSGVPVADGGLRRRGASRVRPDVAVSDRALFVLAVASDMKA
jgi:hypothetical protein